MRSEGTYAWLGLSAYVVAYDLWAIRTGHQTLSSAFYEAVKHPQRRWLVVASWAYLTAHLFRLDNGRFDCFRQALMRKERRE